MQAKTIQLHFVALEPGAKTFHQPLYNPKYSGGIMSICKKSPCEDFFPPFHMVCYFADFKASSLCFILQYSTIEMCGKKADAGTKSV